MLNYVKRAIKGVSYGGGREPNAVTNPAPCLIYTNLRDFKNSPLKSLSHRHFTPIKFHLRKAINQHKKTTFSK